MKKIIKTKKEIFVGNDINNLECLQNVGLPIIVTNAYGQIRDISKITLSEKGRERAVSEVCVLIYFGDH